MRTGGLALPIVGALAFAFALAPRQAEPRPLLVTDADLFGTTPGVAQVRAATKTDGVLVAWRVAPDAPRVTVTLWRNEPGRNSQLVYRGVARSFLDRTAKPGSRYRYTVEATHSTRRQEVDIRTP